MRSEREGETGAREATIRLADEDDAAGVRAIYAPVVEETVISFEGDPPTEAEMADRIADTLPEHPWLVCERAGDEGGGEIAGYAYANPHRGRDGYRWSVDVSVYVAEDHRRKGIGRGLYESLFAVLRRQGFYNAYAGIALPNEASVALHESFGFERVGVYESVGYKRGAWRDVGWWELELQKRPEGPEESDDADNSGRPDAPQSVTDLSEADRREALEVGRETVRS